MKYGFYKIGLALLLLALGLPLSACYPIVREGGFPSARSQRAALQQDAAHYPVTVTSINSRGDMEEETFDKPPERVVAVWQNSIETLLALGVGDRIVAGMGIPNEKYLSPEYRGQYEKIPYTSLQNLDMETITMMNPDIIVGWDSTFSAKVLRDTDYWHERGVRTYISVNSSSKEPEKRWRMNI